MESLKLYPADSVAYDCAAELQTVSLTAFWYLDTEQGAEGQLSPMCTKVVCSHAAKCGTLAKGLCPLTVGYGEVMNCMEIRVMHNHPIYSLGEVIGQLIEVSDHSPAGYLIWFGRTMVLAPGNVTGA